MRAIFLAGAVLTTVSISAKAGPHYAPEINTLRDRERAYVEAAGGRYRALRVYRLAWESANDALLRFRKVAAEDPAAPSATLSLPDTRIALLRERARLESLLTGLRRLESTLGHDLREAETALVLHPGLRREHLRRRDELLARIDTTGDEMDARLAGAGREGRPMARAGRRWP